MNETNGELDFIFKKVTRPVSEEEKQAVAVVRNSMLNKMTSLSEDLENKLITREQYLDLSSQNSVFYMTKTKQIVGEKAYVEMFDTDQTDIQIIDREMFLSITD